VGYPDQSGNETPPEIGTATEAEQFYEGESCGEPEKSAEN
jgi:hypothetical protein